MRKYYEDDPTPDWVEPVDGPPNPTKACAHTYGYIEEPNNTVRLSRFSNYIEEHEIKGVNFNFCPWCGKDLRWIPNSD